MSTCMQRESGYGLDGRGYWPYMSNRYGHSLRRILLFMDSLIYAMFH